MEKLKQLNKELKKIQVKIELNIKYGFSEEYQNIIDEISNLVGARVSLQNAIITRIEKLDNELVKIDNIESPIFKRTEGKRDELESLLKQITDGSILSK